MKKNRALSALIWLTMVFIVLFSLANSFQLTLNNKDDMQYTYYLSLANSSDNLASLSQESNLEVTKLKINTITQHNLITIDLKQKTDSQNLNKYNNLLNIVKVSHLTNYKSDWKAAYVVAVSLSGTIFMILFLLKWIILFIYRKVDFLNLTLIRLGIIIIFCSMYMLGAVYNISVSKFQNDSDDLTYMSFYLKDIVHGQVKVYHQDKRLYVDQLILQQIPVSQITQQCDITKINPELCYLPYNSSFGLQAHIFTFIGNTLRITNINSFMLLCQFIESLILAIIIAELVLVFYQVFGRTVFMSMSLGLLSTYIIAKFAPSVYWNIWIMLLPFLLSTKYMLDKQSRLYESNSLLYGCLFIVFLIKMLFGYEWLSSLVLSAMMPLLWNGKSISFRDKLKPIFVIGVISIFAFIISLVLWWWKLGSSEFYNAVVSDVVRRVSFFQSVNLHPVINVLDINDPTYQESLHVGILTVLTKLILRQDFFLCFGFYSLIIILGYTYYKCYKKGCLTQQLSSLMHLIIISLAAPLSWYIIAKPHSYVHVFLNYFLWLLPTGIYIYLFIGITIHLFLKRRLNG